MQSIPRNRDTESEKGSVIFPCFDTTRKEDSSFPFVSMAVPSPLTKTSPYTYSFLSLEMCTESLGSENGSAAGIDEFPPLERQRQKHRTQRSEKNKKKSSFPPPLTSISGSECVRVHTHREGGRLVIEASAFSSTGRRFVAERGNGRLRLSLLMKEEDEDEDEEEEEEEVVVAAGEEEEDEEFCGHGYVGEKCVIGRCNGGREREMNTVPFYVAIGIS